MFEVIAPMSSHVARQACQETMRHNIAVSHHAPATSPARRPNTSSAAFRPAKNVGCTCCVVLSQSGQTRRHSESSIKIRVVPGADNGLRCGLQYKDADFDTPLGSLSRRSQQTTFPAWNPRSFSNEKLVALDPEEAEAILYCSNLLDTVLVNDGRTGHEYIR